MKASRSDCAIPTVLNAGLVTAVSVLCVGLLYAASHTGSHGMLLLYALTFAVAMVPLYTLLHEAEHELLVPNRRLNDVLGRWLSMLFGVSFAFMKHCHLRHHRKNRTDIEMWDLYLEHQVPWRRRGNLYLMMAGPGYFMLWLSVVLFALAPGAVYGGFFQRHAEIAGFRVPGDDGVRHAPIRPRAWSECSRRSARSSCSRSLR